MKTIATLIFILFIGATAQAQNASELVKVETIEMTIVTNTTSNENKEAALEKKTEVARLYKYKNSRVKKALSFTTKRNKSKMA
jgi:hypothetical protein